MATVAITAHHHHGVAQRRIGDPVDEPSRAQGEDGRLRRCLVRRPGIRMGGGAGVGLGSLRPGDGCAGASGERGGGERESESQLHAAQAIRRRRA